MASDPLILRRHEDGLVETLLGDEAENRFVVRRSADVEPLIDACRREFNAAPARTMGRELVKIASLPTVVLDAYGEARGLPAGWYHRPEYRDEIVRAAHHPDLSAFRTAPGTFITKDR